jgi:5-methylthioribose kinase
MNDPASVLAALRAQGIVRDEAALIPLSGGVSCDVWRIPAADLAPERAADHPSGLVVKAPLARLRVPGVWEADISRGVAEAAALRLYGRLTPDRVPRVTWLDPSGPVLAMESAPPDWADWREQLLDEASGAGLLSGERISAIGAALGATLAIWHEQTRDIGALPPELRTGDRLRTLRTDPFHRATASAVPDLADPLEALADELESARTCLVHADFSPKNVLVAPPPGPQAPSGSGVWMLDAEVAHVGNPVLDVAYLSAHLLLKATKRPALAEQLDSGRRAFEQAYRSGSDLVDAADWSRHTGAILAARVRGMSRVTYLDDAQQDEVLLRARALIRGDLDLDDTWSTLCQAVATRPT